MNEDIEYQALMRRSKRLVGLAFTLVVAMTVVGLTVSAALAGLGPFGGR